MSKRQHDDMNGKSLATSSANGKQREVNGLVTNNSNNDNSRNNNSSTLKAPSSSQANTLSRKAREKLETKARKAELKKRQKEAIRLTATGKHDDVDHGALAIALRNRKRRKKQHSEDLKEVRRIIKKTQREQHERRRKVQKERRKVEKRDKKPSKKQILFAQPDSSHVDADGDADANGHGNALSSMSRRQQTNAWFHDMLAITLPSKETVANKMTDNERHEHLQWLTKQSERLMDMISTLLGSDNDGQNTSVVDDDSIERMGITNRHGDDDDRAMLQQTVMNDMIKLKHIPMARRYVEMGLWKRCKEVSNQWLQKAIEDIENSDGDIDSGVDSQVQTKRKRQEDDVQGNGHGRGCLLVHDESSEDVKFRSFRDKYISKLLVHHEGDLESIRVNEAMDEDHVTFLRGCLDATASLYANINCWDELERRQER